MESGKNREKSGKNRGKMSRNSGIEKISRSVGKSRDREKFPEIREFKKFPCREFQVRNSREIPGSGIPDVGIDFTNFHPTIPTGAWRACYWSCSKIRWQYPEGVRVSSLYLTFLYSKRVLMGLRSHWRIRFWYCYSTGRYCSVQQGAIGKSDIF